MNKVMDGELDAHDRRILREVSNDGRITVTELAKRIGLSKTPCQNRLQKLIDKRYILGFKAVLDAERLDRNHVAFATVKLSDTTEKALASFNRAVQEVDEVEQCHMTAGPFDYLLKVRTKDIMSYRRVLGEVISALPHFESSSTFVSMEAVKEVGTFDL